MKTIILIGICVLLVGCMDKKLEFAQQVCSENDMELGRYTIYCVECHKMKGHFVVESYYIHGSFNKPSDYKLIEGYCLNLLRGTVSS